MQTTPTNHSSHFSKFAAGDYVTYADFMLYDALDFNRMFASNLFEGRAIVTDYLTRIENLSGIKEYMASSEFVKTPLSPKAKWGHPE